MAIISKQSRIEVPHCYKMWPTVSCIEVHKYALCTSKCRMARQLRYLDLHVECIA
jgi:hypothetical protein